jgi:hypothetical protein
LKRTGGATAATLVGWQMSSDQASASNVSPPNPGLSNLDLIAVRICADYTEDVPIPAETPEGGWEQWQLDNLAEDDEGKSNAENKKVTWEVDDLGWVDPEEDEQVFHKSRVVDDGLPTIRLINGIPHVTAGTRVCLTLKVRAVGK